MPVGIMVGWLVLQWGHACAIINNYGGLCQQLHGKSSLQIICTYRQNSYLGHVSDALGKTKENINQLMSEL